MMPGETTHGGQYFVLFFCTKTQHPLTGTRAQTQSDLCFLPHQSIFSSSITHIVTDSSPGGRLYPNKTKPFCCLQDMIHWRRKALWEKRGGEIQTSLAEREDHFLFPLDVFTLQPHVAAVMRLTRTASASYLY